MLLPLLLRFLDGVGFRHKYQVASIKYVVPSTKYGIRVIGYFLSSSKFFTQRSAFDIFNPVFQTSYLVLRTNPYFLHCTWYFVHGTFYTFLLFPRYQFQCSLRIIQNSFLIHQLRAVFSFHKEFFLIGIVLTKAIPRVTGRQNRDGFLYVFKIQ